ncbi:MAG: TRAP transporter fused permease subunit, partial [Desulfobacterales bacterium]|nr:TRAP transporter fused permease subunit [Desulfobacterales bacterium]
MHSRLSEAFIFWVSTLFVVFHLVTPVYAFLPNMRERAIHLGLAFVLIFLGRARQQQPLQRLLDAALSALGLGLCLYVVVAYHHILEQYGTAEGPLQVLMGFALVALVLEAARRAVRPALPLIALIFLLYAIFGHWVPGNYGHPEYSLETVSSALFLTTGGIWGQLLGVSANIIAIFVFLGAFIVYSGGGDGFMKIAIRLAGRYSGGPAKVATISSALFGSISGSASANVASTGAFTIPMMKRLGYSPSLAAAVEAVASTGGQIMPPIMGAGAFVMAELIQTPYLTIAASAALPAVLYFATVGLGIHFYCRKRGYSGLPPEEIPGWRETARASAFFLIPFAVLSYWLVRRYTPQYAAFWAVLSTLLLTFFDTTWHVDLPAVWPRYKQAIVTGARQAAVIAAICGCAQIVVATIAFTGIGIKFSTSIMSLSRNNLLLALVLTGITSTLLGMEVPTTAAYIVAVVVSGPVLVDLGVPAIAAHLFVFYLAILSAITPPVCGAVFIAAGMAEADWVRTAGVALKLAFGLFLLPFLFALD